MISMDMPVLTRVIPPRIFFVVLIFQVSLAVAADLVTLLINFLVVPGLIILVGVELREVNAEPERIYRFRLV